MEGPTHHAQASWGSRMIVVCGEVSIGAGRSGTVGIARHAAGAGADVQLVAVVPDGAAGDRWLLELGSAAVRHTAVLREPGRPLEAADVDLALRYLPDIRVIVTVEQPRDVERAAGDHAGSSGAALVVVHAGGAATTELDDVLPESAIVLVAPRVDPDGAFAGFVGALAARLDAGVMPADAWAATTSELAVDSI